MVWFTPTVFGFRNTNSVSGFQLWGSRICIFGDGWRFEILGSENADLLEGNVGCHTGISESRKRTAVQITNADTIKFQLKSNNKTIWRT